MYKNILVRFESNELSMDLIPNTTYSSGALTLVHGSMSANAETGGIDEMRNTASRDCGLCQRENVPCKVFVAGDSESSVNVCENCEEKMTRRNTIKNIEKMVQYRLKQES